ncbi:MAG: Crp/Fnr family transcriptional regulator [Deltaproteobacteria bacterium]|nr:Crp/Fnr family transcriptional regulator [Deltaproteobacteria bacterium]
MDKSKAPAFASKMGMGSKSPVSRQHRAAVAPRTASASQTQTDDVPQPMEHEETPEPRLVPLRQLHGSSLQSGAEQQDAQQRHEEQKRRAEELSPVASVRFVPSPQQALQDLAIFKGVEPSLRDTLIQRGTTQTLLEGTQIMREGETPSVLVSILKGTAKLFFTAGNGRVGHARIAFAPTSIGHHEIATQQPLQASLKLIEKSTLWTLPALELKRALAVSSRMQENVLAETAAELREMSELARALLFDDTASRLAQMMLKFVERRGLPGQEGAIIPLALTQQDFAETLGVDLRSINRVMVDWFSERLVIKSEKRFVIVNPEKLTEIALQHRPK